MITAAGGTVGMGILEYCLPGHTRFDNSVWLSTNFINQHEELAKLAAEQPLPEQLLRHALCNKKLQQNLEQHDHQGRTSSLLASVAEGPARSLTINQTTGNYRI